MQRELETLENEVNDISHTITITPDDDPNTILLLASLGEAYDKRYDILQKLDDNKQAIESRTKALTMAPSDHPLIQDLLRSLGAAHAQRFKRLDELEDLEKAIQYQSRALSWTRDSHPDLPSMFANIGTSYNYRFQRLGKLADLEKSIQYRSRALHLTPDGHPDFPSRLANLGVSHSYRFHRLGELDDLEKAIQYESRALRLTPDGHPDLSSWLNNLGIFYAYRSQRLGELDDLEKAIQYGSRALSLTPDGHPDLSSALANLGISHSYRFEGLGKMEDLDKAIQYHSRALILTPDRHPHLSGMLANLGVSHASRFERLGEPADLEKAIQFHDRFERLGELADLDKAIQYGSRALDLTPDDHPLLSSWLANLGASHTYRFERLGELADLEKIIQYQSRAVDLIPSGHPHLSTMLADLGASHGNRFGCLGELKDLEKAIQYLSRAVSLTPAGNPYLPSMLADLGTSYNSRFERLDDLKDLEKAIQYKSRALSLTPDDHPQLSSRFANLGVSHIDRFERLGELTDLEKGVQYLSRAVSLTPDDHSELSSRVASLGISHASRFRRLDELVDLEKAIQYGSRPLKLTPDDHPDLSTQLNNLGTFHDQRFKRLGEPSDLEKAMQYRSRALDLIPDEHPHLSGMLANIGISHTDRFQCLGELGDLEKANHYQSRAIAVTPDGHPHLDTLHSRSATLSLLQYQRTNDSTYLDHSLHSFRLATQSTSSAPRSRFRCACMWALAASDHSALNPIEAYQAAIEILPQFIWLGATTTQRYEDLLTADTLAVDAAHAAILSSDHALALEWLEHARCVVWTQNIMLRSPLDRLQSLHPNLALKLQTIATQLHSASLDTQESRVLMFGSKNAEEVSQEHRRLAQEHDKLITQVRRLAGFEDFLRPMKANSLIRAARHGPIVVINCHADRCDALVIQHGQNDVDHIPLPNFSGERAMRVRFDMEMAVRSMQVTERGTERRPMVETEHEVDFKSVLGTLWHDIVKPILDFLGYTNDVRVGNLPHITWCPTGAISFLPLHAAGDYDQTQSRVFNYVISSYTPTLTAILESTPNSLRTDPRILAIGQPTTPGHSPLPGTTREIMQLQAQTAHKLEFSQLIDSEATKSAVLDAMEQHDWVHLACHAHQNISDATKSGFFMHDEILDLASINRRSFKNKGLAFLSACQTATGDEKLPDEAVHLASGMLMAGYTSVIATMWSVVDVDAPVVSDSVYAQLMKDRKLGSGEAGRALHNAVEVLREEVGEKAFERWVPYIHVGS